MPDKNKFPVALVLFLSVIVMACASSSGGPTSSAILPEPVEIVETERADHPEQTLAVEAELDELLKRTTITASKGDRAKAARVTADSLRFLIREFGSPPRLEDRVVVAFADKRERHAEMELRRDGTRRIEIDALNLFESQRHFLVHELFHAFFQTRAMLRRSTAEIESWATYAQYRFVYRNLSNDAARQRLINDFALAKRDLGAGLHEPWSGVKPVLSAKRYVANALPLFTRDRRTVYWMYRRLIEGPTPTEVAPSPVDDYPY